MLRKRNKRKGAASGSPVRLEVFLRGNAAGPDSKSPAGQAFGEVAGGPFSSPLPPERENGEASASPLCLPPDAARDRFPLARLWGGLGLSAR